MTTKLDQAKRIGFDIELFFEDLYYVAQDLPGGATSENQVEAARIIRSMCKYIVTSIRYAGALLSPRVIFTSDHTNQNSG